MLMLPDTATDARRVILMLMSVDYGFDARK